MRHHVRSFLCSWLLLTAAASVRADGPADNNPATVRRVPKLGVEVTPEQRQKLEAGIARLAQSIQELKGRKDARDLLPDVQIYHKAAHDALKYQEFFAPKEIDDALKMIDVGQQRADQLKAGQAPWTSAVGQVVRGYISKIDGSVQPYGLVIPATYGDKGPHGFRLDLWFHGRGETLSELNFLRDRSGGPGQFAPANTIVLHPYGRYSNANKFAGEVDTLEAIDSVKRRYRIDEERIAVRGFSMGGAACWQFAVHYSDRWFAANPGAGFAETPEFLKSFQKQDLQPTWWEKRLWRWYDCPDLCLNLKQCPTVAYSGELDVQKQAADIMEAALAKEQIDLVHIIGAQTKHAYNPPSRDEVERRLASLARHGRERTPKQLTLVTYTLKYNRMNWLTVDGIGQHWERARVDARWEKRDASIALKTENVTALTLEFEPGESPFDVGSPVSIVVDQTRIEAPRARSDRSWQASLHKVDGRWQLGRLPGDGLRKRHDLQGPIDDAFMDSFIFVRPTGQARHPAVGQWAAAELARATEHWRRHFRGEARVKDDTQIQDDDVANANLVLWGDPSSNAVLAKIADRLPIGWDARQIMAGGRNYPADSHAVVAIYPNPLNPSRYVVLNSSFTFREFAYLNNARQVPMLPDWAVVDLRTPPDTVWPGKIADAGFFDEQWRMAKPGM